MYCQFCLELCYFPVTSAIASCIGTRRFKFKPPWFGQETSKWLISKMNELEKILHFTVCLWYFYYSLEIKTRYVIKILETFLLSVLRLTVIVRLHLQWAISFYSIKNRLLTDYMTVIMTFIITLCENEINCISNSSSKWQISIYKFSFLSS